MVNLPKALCKLRIGLSPVPQANNASHPYMLSSQVTKHTTYIDHGEKFQFLQTAIELWDITDHIMHSADECVFMLQDWYQIYLFKLMRQVC